MRHVKVRVVGSVSTELGAEQRARMGPGGDGDGRRWDTGEGGRRETTADGRRESEMVGDVR